MCDYVVLPLLNSSFEPGRAREVVEGFVDVDLRNIARAELFYFTGQAEECCEITRRYLSSRVIELKLSACILYGYLICRWGMWRRLSGGWRGSSPV